VSFPDAALASYRVKPQPAYRRSLPADLPYARGPGVAARALPSGSVATRPKVMVNEGAKVIGLGSGKAVGWPASFGAIALPVSPSPGHHSFELPEAVPAIAWPVALKFPEKRSP